MWMQEWSEAEKYAEPIRNSVQPFGTIFNRNNFWSPIKASRTTIRASEGISAFIRHGKQQDREWRVRIAKYKFDIFGRLQM